MNYRCDICGCYLDPGEGRTCDECQQREAEQRKQHFKGEMEYENGTQDDRWNGTCLLSQTSAKQSDAGT